MDLAVGNLVYVPFFKHGDVIVTRWTIELVDENQTPTYIEASNPGFDGNMVLLPSDVFEKGRHAYEAGMRRLIAANDLVKLHNEEHND